MATAFPPPFNGAISTFYAKGFPKALRKHLEAADEKDMLSQAYPYPREMKRRDYEATMAPLQIELQKLQLWVKATGARILVLFEGRDAAGKGGAIRRVMEHLNPRGARVVALSKPSDVERGQWYFQRYVPHLPAQGEIVLFDRSWYNRAGVETVMGFCTEEEHERFFVQAPAFERMLVADEILLLKIFVSVGRGEQMRRFLAREADPLKNWKLSPIDVASLERWDDYSTARDVMFSRTHTPDAPWRVIRGDCKKRARIEAIRLVLGLANYDGKDADTIGALDPEITISPAKVSSGDE